MERIINWYSGCRDEIELVYDKADQNALIAAILMELETMALREAEESCGMYISVTNGSNKNIIISI